MSKFNLEVSGKFKSTTSGNTDWYYGGGGIAWADIATALAGVPSVIRPGKTIGVLVEGKVKEYWWQPGAVGDGDILVKDSSEGVSNFTTLLDSSIASTEDFGLLPKGTLVSDLNGETISSILEDAIFKVKEAFINEEPRVDITGITQTELEAGINISSSINLVFDRGEIYNGDGTLAGNVVGNASTVTITQVESATNRVENDSVSLNNYTLSLDPYKLLLGVNTWSGVINYTEGTSTYENSHGVATTNLSSFSAAGSLTFNTESIIGRRRWWAMYTEEGSSSVSSSTLRNSSQYTGLLGDNNNKEFTIDVPSGSSNAEVSIYVPAGKSIEVKDLGNLGIDISDEFTVSAISINDPSGTAIDYLKYTRLTGSVGYTKDTMFNVKVS